MPLVSSGDSHATVTRLPTALIVGLRGAVGVAVHDEVTELHAPTPYSFAARTRNITDTPDGIPEMYWNVLRVRPSEIHVAPPSRLCSTS